MKENKKISYFKLFNINESNYIYWLENNNVFPFLFLRSCQEFERLFKKIEKKFSK